MDRERDYSLNIDYTVFDDDKTVAVNFPIKYFYFNGQGHLFLEEYRHLDRDAIIIFIIMTWLKI